MDRIEKLLLHRELQYWKKKYIFDKIKWLAEKRYISIQNKNISFRDNNAFINMSKSSEPQRQSDSIQTVQLENKQLYLKYMQEVLTNKQQQLLEIQQNLQKQKLQLEQINFNKKLIEPINLNQDVETLSMKIDYIKDLMRKYAQKNNMIDKEIEDLVKSLNSIEENCARNSDHLKNTLKKQHQIIIKERQILTSKLSKLTELESYQKYLNELQHLLEFKQFEVIKRQKQVRMNTGFYLSSNHDPNKREQFVLQNNYNTFEQAEDSKKGLSIDERPQSDQSSRKRVKIFENKVFQSGQSFGDNKHRESSKIMQENSTNDNQFNNKIQKSSEKVENCVNFEDMCTQTNFETADHAMQRLHKEKIYIKFLRLWFKFSDKFTNGTNQHRKYMNFYVWKLNALYGEQLKNEIEANIGWPSKITKLGQIGSVNYGDLSLRKRRYAELFFDFERKRNHQKKIINSLKIVIKNKNRKQRLAFFLIFKRYLENARYLSLLNIQAPNAHREPLKQKSNRNTIYEGSKSKIGNSRPTVESRVYSVTNSNVQNRVMATDSSKKIKNVTVKDSSSKNLLVMSNNHLDLQRSKTKASKDNLNGSIDLIKLKQYIRQHEQAEARLAIDCAKIESTFKIMRVLSPLFARNVSAFLINFIRQKDFEKMRQLDKTINSYQFKWELFMAKARLALTNNGNKISHLQQLVSLMADK